jgi:hypothetical protein
VWLFPSGCDYIILYKVGNPSGFWLFNSGVTIFKGEIHILHMEQLNQNEFSSICSFVYDTLECHCHSGHWVYHDWLKCWCKCLKPSSWNDLDFWNAMWHFIHSLQQIWHQQERLLSSGNGLIRADILCQRCQRHPSVQLLHTCSQHHVSHWVLAAVPGYLAAVQVSNRTGWSSLGGYPETRGTHRVRGRVETGLRFHFTVPTTFTPIKYLSSDRIMTW